MTREGKTKKLVLPVQFDLIIPDGSGEVTGTYFYKKIGQKIDVSGTPDGQTITLSERDNKTGKVAGTFTLEYSDEQLSGIWNKSGSKDTFQVLLNLVKPASIDGFWDGFIGKNRVRFFLYSNQDEQYGVYYLLSDKFLTGCEISQTDSTITEIYSDYPEKNLRGGVWKYSYVTADTMKGTIAEDLHYNTENEPGAPFTLVKHSPSFCDDFYGCIDSAFIIKEEDTIDYSYKKLYAKLTVHNSGLHYYGIKIVSPIPKQSKINQLLRTVIPFDGELKDEVLKKRKGDCISPTDYEDYANLEIIDWGERYLTVMIEAGEFPRYLNFRAVIIDLNTAEIVEPSAWFKDSLECLTYKTSVGNEGNFDEVNCEEVCRNFFIKLSKTGTVKLQSVKDDNRLFIIDNEKISFYQTIISPSDEGISFHLSKVDSNDEFVSVTINYNDIVKYLTPAGMKALKPKN